MLIFFDSEFNDLGIDPKLISIGLISEDGTHEFYAELSGTYPSWPCASRRGLKTTPAKKWCWLAMPQAMLAIYPRNFRLQQLACKPAQKVLIALLREIQTAESVSFSDR